MQVVSLVLEVTLLMSILQGSFITFKYLIVFGKFRCMSFKLGLPLLKEWKQHHFARVSLSSCIVITWRICPARAVFLVGRQQLVNIAELILVDKLSCDSFCCSFHHTSLQWACYLLFIVSNNSMRRLSFTNLAIWQRICVWCSQRHFLHG